MMVVNKRPDWDEYFMGIAVAATRRSTCLHRQIAAIIVKEKQIVSVGYNGNLPQRPHCLDVGCARDGVPSGQRMELCRGVHAEQNAIAMAARFGNAVKGGCLYTTHFPCSSCAKLVVRAGIVEVIYGTDYPDPLAKKLLDDSGIAVRKVEMVIVDCNFCHKTTEKFLIVPSESWVFGGVVMCLKCLDGVLTWLEHSTKTAEYLQDAVDSV